MKFRIQINIDKNLKAKNVIMLLSIVIFHVGNNKNRFIFKKLHHSQYISFTITSSRITVIVILDMLEFIFAPVLRSLDILPPVKYKYRLQFSFLYEIFAMEFFNNSNSDFILEMLIPKRH